MKHDEGFAQARRYPQSFRRLFWLLEIERARGGLGTGLQLQRPSHDREEEIIKKYCVGR